ncbi:MAG TPA: roadblock/LC7 domain-containing protein [Nocardia sp.]|uniref:roadblock/LC7 domain-containing protein n=1 Tax=Nocardia TaxID=1817 RepID=UPI0024554D89|nr:MULTISPECIES: roadblock/LC7 domain-containing protein [Nocardia]HLS78977.1 roadblock/LC7 domain-containing protein [Nocardia sp.]
MTARKKLLGEWMGRLTKVSMSGPEPYAVVLAELHGLRERVPRLTGSLVASGDGLLITHDLPGHIEPDGMAALTASHLALSYRVSSTAHGGSFDEVVVRGSGGCVVIYTAGWASLTVLAEPEVNVGRLHLESRPVARAIADHLTALSNGPRHKQSTKVE